MEAAESSLQPPTTPRKKMVKQLTGKREDSPLHSAARAGRILEIKEIINGATDKDGELRNLLSKKNSAGETPLFVAAEYGYSEIVREMIKHYSLADAGIKANNGFDALHIAAKQGDLGIYEDFCFSSPFSFSCFLLSTKKSLFFFPPFCVVEVVKVLMEAHPELSMTVDSSNTTALHTAASQGHIEIVEYFLESESNLATIAKSNGKTALHSAARNGHLRAVDALLAKDTTITTRTDKKGQTALHMAVKGQNPEVVEKLIMADPSTINMVDTKGNTALHIATRKGRAQVYFVLVQISDSDQIFGLTPIRFETINLIQIE